MNKIEEQDLIDLEKTFRDNLAHCVFKRKPRLDWMPPAYPGAYLLFQPKVLNEWEDLLGNLSNELSPSQKKKLAGFFQKYPFALSGMKRLLWQKDSYTAALSVLEKVATPDCDAEMLRFALSQTGTLKARTETIMILIHNGRYTGPKDVRLWDDDLEEWRDVTLNT